MKKFYTLFLAVLISVNLSAITYTSAQNGNWTSPTTWNPMGVPTPGDVAIINHDVVLNTDFAYTTGTIIVNSSGSLTEDVSRNLWLNGVGAGFTNNGSSTINRILVSDGTASNAGILNVKILANYSGFYNTATGTINNVDSMYNDGTYSNKGNFNVMTFFNNDSLYNSGTIKGLTTVVDSMFNNGVFLNVAGALLQADSCTNNMTFTNDGIINFNQFTNSGIFINNNYLSFDDFTNYIAADFTNTDSLIGNQSMHNWGDFDNQNGGILNLGVSFLNSDLTNSDANFNNDGKVTMGDSFFNFDTITGGVTGNFTLQDSSVNYTNGYMIGDFDFCDLTPPVTPIKIDYNLGSVDANITYCTATEVSKTLNVSVISIYPNPTTGVLNIATSENVTVEIYNVIGKQLLSTQEKSINISVYDNGMYMFIIKNEEGEILQQSKLLKQ